MFSKTKCIIKYVYKLQHIVWHIVRGCVPCSINSCIAFTSSFRFYSCYLRDVIFSHSFKPFKSFKKNLLNVQRQILVDPYWVYIHNR